jgi:hypothetical protein
MRDGDHRPFWLTQSYDLSIELVRKRLDDAGAEPCFRLSKDPIRFADPIVTDRKLPIGSGCFIPNDDATFGFLVWERVLQSIHDEFSHDQAKALRLAGRLHCLLCRPV